MIIKCQTCGKHVKTFPSRTKKQFCSIQCRSKFRSIGKHIERICVSCGKKFMLNTCYLKHDAGIFCSVNCCNNGKPYVIGGDNNKGYIRPDGYREVSYRGELHLEHRLIMEIIIGRKLDTEEGIHHLDNNKLNNSENNLQIISAQEHCKLHKTGIKASKITREKFSNIATNRVRDYTGRFIEVARGN